MSNRLSHAPKVVRAQTISLLSLYFQLYLLDTIDISQVRYPVSPARWASDTKCDLNAFGSENHHHTPILNGPHLHIATVDVPPVWPVQDKTVQAAKYSRAQISSSQAL